MADDVTRALTTASWTLVSYRAGDLVAPAGGRDAVLELSPDGAASGSTGCNRFFGRWEADARALSVQVGGTTMMAGDEAAMEQERWVLENLAAVTGWAVVGHSLVLTDADGGTRLTYAGQSVDDLPGSSWVATGVNNGRQAVVSSAFTPLLTLELADDGRAFGSSGCNHFTGPFELVGDDAVHIGPLAVTRKHCPNPEVMELEQQYLDALERSVVIQFQGDHLTLRDAGGATQATFRRAP